MSTEAMPGDSTPESRLGIFAATGVELEYMLADAATLDVLPRTDEVLRTVAGSYQSDFDHDDGISWSNELVLHVIELKCNPPAPRLEPLVELFQRHVERVNGILATMGGRLLPGGMHPWMDPGRETRLWPHEYSKVYEAFDRIFGCGGHGWSNLQSLHLNLPFADDEEFGRLHAGIRLLLPLLPAIAASSPVVEGRVTGSLDNRMEAYRGNAGKVPSVGGEVVPEPVFTRRAYEEQIFAPMFAEIAPHDPEGTLRDEFLNSRGAIARFGRGSIEIRVIDVQECPRADLAISALVVGVLKLLASELWSPLPVQQSFPVAPLARLLRRCVMSADQADVDDGALLAAFGYPGSSCTAGQLWHHLAEAVFAEGTADPAAWGATVEALLRRGCLSRSLLAALGPEPGRRDLERVWRRLGDCLAAGELFV